MKHEEKIAHIRLIRTQNIGPVTMTILLKRYKTAAAVIDALPDIARRSRVKLAITQPTEAEKEWERVTKAGGEILVRGEDGYPDQLAMFDDAPGCISYIGHKHLLLEKSVAIVGARNASANALALTEQLAAGVGQGGFVIISGFARGIDAAAHRGSLATGTIGIMAGGIDQIYPRENDKLYDRICAEGLVMSEMPWGMQPYAQHFPIRNRIIAALCGGLLVTEASNRSGSLITAREALERGREVMAIPGTPMDPRSEGCNQLITEGAALIRTSDDVLRIMRAQTAQAHSPKPTPPLDLDIFAGKSAAKPQDAAPQANVSDIQAAKQELHQLLSYQPTAIDDVIKHSEFSFRIINAALFEMELAGEVSRHHGNRVSLVLRADKSGTDDG